MILQTWEKIIGDPAPPWDIYWEYSYCKAWEIEGAGYSRMFSYVRGDSVWFHVFLLNPIPDTDYFDIQTPYGYGGPLTNNSDPDFIFEASQAFGEWARSNRVVCEFIRFHPILKNESFVSDSLLTIEENRTTVFIDLRLSEEQLYEEMDASFRRGIRKATVNRLRFQELRINEYLPQFVSLYNATMRRVEAGPFYFFKPEHFAALSDSRLKPALLGVFDVEELLAGALLFVGDEIVHYHLGASDPRFLEKRPNNFLFYNMVLWAKNKKPCKILHLGGGFEKNPGNSLFKFKASVGKGRALFNIGKRIWNETVYRELCEQAVEKKPQLASLRKNYFQIYRVSKSRDEHSY